MHQNISNTVLSQPVLTTTANVVSEDNNFTSDRNNFLGINGMKSINDNVTMSYNHQSNITKI